MSTANKIFGVDVSNVSKVMGVEKAKIAKINGVTFAIPVSQGIIAIWKGTIANIPAGWNLCDGAGGRPNLLAKFLKSVPDAVTDPGGGGGSDTHLHVEVGTGGSHNHGGTSGSGGAHTHTTPTTRGNHAYSAHGGDCAYASGSGPQCGYTGDAGNHNHTWSSGGAHTHPIDAQGAHAHTFQNADTRPAYYEVAFIYSDGTPTFTEGIIALWSDVLGNIPAGWSLDATLVAKFLRSVPAATEPGGTGGADSHLHTQDAGGAHTHTLSSVTHSHTSNSAGSHVHGVYTPSDEGYGCGNETNGGAHTHPSSTAGDHTHTAASPGTHAHIVNSSDGRPPYHELAPIAAGEGGAPQEVGMICIWNGTIANIPDNWELCDGNGGRPNLLSKFIRGVATAETNPGATGGNLTHTHTVQAAGDHTHTVDSQGAHVHAAASSNATWSHNHGSVYDPGGANILMCPSNYGPSHNHGDLSNTGAHSNHSITASGDHSDHTYGTASSLPAYYEVAFIIKVS